MLIALVALTLSQCSKDTDCKGDRICAAGECVDTPPRAATLAPIAPESNALAQAARVARIIELKSELRELHERLEDATLSGPIVKLIGASAFSGLGFVLFVAAESRPSGDPGITSTLGGAIASGVAAVVLWVLGGIQLHLRINDKRNLPGEIETREEQLRILAR